MVEQQVVRVALVRLDNTNVTMCERMMPEPDALDAFAVIAKDLTGRVIKEPILDPRPGLVDYDDVPRRSHWRRVVPYVLAATLGFATFAMSAQVSYHQGWRAGYDQGAADVRRAYGPK